MRTPAAAAAAASAIAFSLWAGVTCMATFVAFASAAALVCFSAVHTSAVSFRRSPRLYGLPLRRSRTVVSCDASSGLYLLSERFLVRCYCLVRSMVLERLAGSEAQAAASSS